MPILIYDGSTGKIRKNSSYGTSYSGEKDMGTLNNWTIFNSDPNAILKSTYGLLCERSATLYHTYGPARGAVNKQTDYAIGPGLVFRSQPDYKTLGQTEDWGREWGKEFQALIRDYYLHLNYFEKQPVLFRGGLYSGDSLLFFLRNDDGTLDDVVEVMNNQIDWRYNGPNNENWTFGVRHDEWYRREAIRTAAGETIEFQDEYGNQNVVQFYIKELPRQVRGYPLAYSIINLSRNDDTSNDAIMHRHVLEAILMGVFKSDGTTNFQQQAANLAEQNRINKQKVSYSPIRKIASSTALGAGNIVTTGSNENLQFTDLKTPSNTFGPLKEVILNYIGMSTGTPPEVITGKYNTTFTAHKGALNDFSKSFMYKRAVFSRKTNDVTNAEILKDAIINGYIKAPGFLTGNWRTRQAYLRGMYLGPVPGHINPYVEVRADKEAVQAGFKLRSDIAALNGYEWNSFISEWEEEQQRWSSSPQEYKERSIYNQETGGANA